MFLLRLAMTLGRTVGELLAAMDSAEFSEWIEFFTTIEPFPSERSAWGHATTAASVANANRGRGSRAVSPADMVVRFGPQREAQSEELMTANMEAFAAAVAKTRRRPSPGSAPGSAPAPGTDQPPA